MATFGLRPEELRYLVLKPGLEGPQLWCTYQKKGGGGQTRPRQLFPLPVRDLDGTAPNWNLIGRLQLQEELPPLGPPGSGGDAANTYLKRQTIWKQLRAEAAAIGEVLVPYSLRHRYSYEGHRLGIAAKDLSQAMGHSLECHLRTYARFTSDETANAFATATERLEKSLAVTSEDSRLSGVLPNLADLVPIQASADKIKRLEAENVEVKPKAIRRVRRRQLHDVHQLSLGIPLATPELNDSSNMQ